MNQGLTCQCVVSVIVCRPPPLIKEVGGAEGHPIARVHLRKHGVHLARQAGVVTGADAAAAGVMALTQVEVTQHGGVEQHLHRHPVAKESQQGSAMVRRVMTGLIMVTRTGDVTQVTLVRHVGSWPSLG
jgi:hypothetical protein